MLRRNHVEKTGFGKMFQ